MKQIVKGLLAAVFCGILLLTAACGGGNGNSEGGSSGQGRYVETKLTLPEGRVIDFYLLPDKSLNLLIHDYNDVPVMYNTRDFSTWQPVEMGWYENLGEDEILEHIAYDDSGVLYALTYHSYYDENEKLKTQFTLHQVGADGSSLEEIPVDWYQAPGREVRMVVDGFKILGNGDFLLFQSFDQGVVQYGSDGSLKEVYETYESYGNGTVVPAFTVNGSTLAVLDQGSVRIYDGAGGELEEQMNLENNISSSGIYYGENDILYIQNSSGLYRLNPGGSLWEKIIDGELNSMSLPGLSFFSLIEMENGDVYMLAGDDKDKFVMLEYHYDPDIATLPEHELVVYSLLENDILRLAAIEYQKLYPDTKINIQTAGSDGSATTGDQLRALNTELLAGKGPDILILDSMNVEAYIDKGVLLDLSGMVDELTADRPMVETVLRAYEKDGRICALPVKYYMPIMIVEQQAAADIASLDDMVRYAAAHPELGIQGDLSPEALLEALMPACAPTWITDGTIDTEQLSAYLEAVHVIMNTGAESHPYEGLGYETNYVMDMEQFHYAYGRSHAYMGTMRGVFDATHLFPILETREGSVITYLAGQQEKCYVPVTITGINANSTQVERAKDFLRVMLSDAVQYDGGETSGFAVSITAQEEEAEFFIERFLTGPYNPFDNEEDLLAGWAPVELQKEVIQLAQGVENPSTIDENLKAMIIDAAKGFLTGEKSLEQAIADVEEATMLYLAE